MSSTRSQLYVRLDQATDCFVSTPESRFCFNAMISAADVDIINSTSTSNKDDPLTLTILGFGSLLSERSSRLTFPDLTNFRLVRVPNYRRVFGHPTSIFFQRGIAHLESKQMSSLSAEYCEGFPGFIACAFDVSNHNGAMMQNTGVPSEAFLEREEEFDICTVPYYELSSDGANMQLKQGILCARSSDEAYLQRWSKERFDDHFTKYGIDTIWNWKPDSGLRPCAVYLRHCYLAAKNMGDKCFTSFLDETFLVDRTTTIRQYVDQYPQVLEQRPPPELAERYCG